ncbi:MAG: hypothetical protein AAGJ50_12490 [Pseudomonadota bacterium]
MTRLRIFLAAAFLAVLVYTLMVVGAYGVNFLSPAVANVLAMDWSGQFTLDFLTYLILSAIWVAWRHAFSSRGLLLGLMASVGGLLFLAPYLLIIGTQSKGDIKTLLVGEHRAHVA